MLRGVPAKHEKGFKDSRLPARRAYSSERVKDPSEGLMEIKKQPLEPDFYTKGE